jgi:hypothetical protein
VHVPNDTADAQILHIDTSSVTINISILVK